MQGSCRSKHIENNFLGGISHDQQSPKPRPWLQQLLVTICNNLRLLDSLIDNNKFLVKRSSSVQLVTTLMEISYYSYSISYYTRENEHFKCEIQNFHMRVSHIFYAKLLFSELKLSSCEAYYPS